MAKTVFPIDPQLPHNLKLAKANLKIAAQNVINAESAIYEAGRAHIKETGTVHLTGVKVETSFNEKWNQEKLVEIESTWARKANLAFPFKREWKPDGKALTYVKENAPEAFKVLQEALTSTPAKPAFTLEDA